MTTPARFWDLEYVSAQISDCTQHHPCGLSGYRELPTRLLDLGGLDQDRLKLIITKDCLPETEGINYAALSYCWGTSTPFTTEPSTLELRLRGISLSDLPLTLRETVKVTRELGIRYLWIDALCILQGPREDVVAQTDWRQESARMHLVYGNAFITIVAAGARNSQEGLMCGNCYLLKPPAGGSSRRKSFAHGAPDYINLIGSQPISERAWALQEWLLSSRLLVFTKWGAQFCCDQYPARAILPCHAYRLPKFPSGIREFDWQLIVMNLCSRSMKEPGDKLHALSGLAQRFGNLLNWPDEDYLAGLWRKTLLYDLLWMRSPQRNRLLGLPEVQAVARRDRAPSWSWASIDGDVHYQMRRTAALDCTEIRKCDVKLATEGNAFGAVDSGLLVIHCLCIKTWLTGPKPRENVWNLLDVFYDGVGQCYMDIDDESHMMQLVSCPGDEDTALYCLALAIDSPIDLSSWGRLLRGIVVKFEESRDAYIRVGFFRAFNRTERSYGLWTERDFVIV